MKKEKALIFGIGKYFQSKKHALEKEYDIVGFLDNHSQTKEIDGKSVYRVSDLMKLQYEKIVIMSTAYYMEMANQLIFEGGGNYEAIEFGQNIEPYIGDEALYFNKKSRLGIDENGFFYAWEKNDRFEEDLKIYFEHKSELSNIQAVWAKGEYNILENITDEKVDVFDIGMNLGGVSLWFANHKIVENVYGVEPSESTYRKAEHNISINPISRRKIQIFNVGLDNYDGQERALYNEEMSCGFSTDQRHNDISIKQYVDWVGMDIKNNRYIDVTIRNAAGFLLERLGKNKVVVKMDCEGSEYHIFEELEKANCIQKIWAYIIEWHDDGPDYIVELLKKHGFAMLSMQDSSDKGMIYAFHQS